MMRQDTPKNKILIDIIRNHFPHTHVLQET